METVGKLGHPFCSGLNRLTLTTRAYDYEKKKEEKKKKKNEEEEEKERVYEDVPARLVGW